MIEQDNISMASYNSNMFKGLDSISQIGDSRDGADQFEHSLEQFDLGAVKYELQAREKKIRELYNDKLKLKNLLKKLAEQKLAHSFAEK
jgi:hypothetical protein